MRLKNISKEAIVTEYLDTDITYRELEAKYGYPYSSICHWVLGRKSKADKPGRKPPKRKKAVQKALPEEVEILQRALLKTQPALGGIFACKLVCEGIPSDSS